MGLTGTLPLRDSLAPRALAATFGFAVRRAGMVVPLLVAIAFGRFVQTGAPALAGAFAQVVLEVLVETGRVWLALMVLGEGSGRRGFRAVRAFFRMDPRHRDARWREATQWLRRNWRALVLEVGLFAVIAVVLNALIQLASASPAAQAAAGELLAVRSSGPTPIELALKNLTTIPLVIIFQIRLAQRIWTAGR